MAEEGNILLGITGSVAAVKGPELCLKLLALNYAVKVLLTKGGAHFWHKAKDYDPISWQAMQEMLREKKIAVHFPDDEWQEWNQMGDPVLHIELRDWADLAVIAPLSAHTLAKVAHGLCDDTLTCVLRAWDLGPSSSSTTAAAAAQRQQQQRQQQQLRPAKPIVLCPAMNAAMWHHPLTNQQLQTIQSFSSCVRVIMPVVKELACGEVGQGALAPVEEIVSAVQEAMKGA